MRERSVRSRYSPYPASSFLSSHRPSVATSDSVSRDIPWISLPNPENNGRNGKFPGDQISTTSIARDNDKQRSYAHIDTPASSSFPSSQFVEAAAKREADKQNEDKFRPMEKEFHGMADEIVRKTGISPYSETTAIEEQHSQDLAGSASDLLRDLSGQLRGRSDYPTMSGGFGDIWKCELVKLNEIVQVCHLMANSHL
jgi:hypothetical protein